ncbi:MFS transporter [Rhodobacter sp. KR11]|uniref:MFS transporter n=1 Tax=Rhodobacter sp. KR11 TaxID=2974588 RepID=UPI00222276C5|nr:MFS transporter [Rhodobacter sp. KR11]
MRAENAGMGRWAVAALFLINGFNMGAWATQIPQMMERHQIGESDMGKLIVMVGVGAVSAMIFAGKLIAAHGSRKMVLIFALCFIPMFPLMILAPSPWLAVPFLFLFGAFGGCMDVAMNANAVAVEQKLGRAIMSSSHGFWSLGGFIGGALGGAVIDRYGFAAQALGVAGLCALTLALVARHVVEDPPHEGATKPKAQMFPRVAVLYLLGAMALFSMVPEGAVLDWAAVYVRDELGAGLTAAGLAFGLFSGAMAVMRFLGDAVRNRFGAVTTLRYSGIIGGLGILAGAMAPTPEIAIAGFAFAGIGVANMVPIMFSAAGNYPGLPMGSGIATTTMIGYTGYLLAPGIIGFIAEHVGFRYTYGAVALLLLLVAGLASKAQAADGVKA